MWLLQQREDRLQKWQTFVSGEIQTLFRVFYRVNGIVIAFVTVAWIVQTVFAFNHPNAPSPPVVITEKVVLALIAASAAQLGLLAIGVGRVLFKPPPPDKHVAYSACVQV